MRPGIQEYFTLFLLALASSGDSMLCGDNRATSVPALCFYWLSLVNLDPQHVCVWSHRMLQNRSLPRLVSSSPSQLHRHKNGRVILFAYSSYGQ